MAVPIEINPLQSLLMRAGRGSDGTYQVGNAPVSSEQLTGNASVANPSRRGSDGVLPTAATPVPPGISLEQIMNYIRNLQGPSSAY